MGRDAIIISKMPEILAEYEALPGTSPSGRLCCSCRPESVSRCVNGTRFCCVAGVGLLNAASPWALATAEAVTMVLLYALTLPHKYRSKPYTLAASPDDVLAVSLLRSGMALVCHFWGTGELHQRPYLYCVMAFGFISLPLSMFKIAALEQGPLPPAKHPALLLFFLIHAAFALAHMVCARQVSIWARRRYDLGLTGLGYPWEEGEQTWLLAGELAARADLGFLPTQDDGAACLQFSDSLFMTDVLGVTVHYRLVDPQGLPRATPTVILLLHGFGGGVFSWRYVMQPLADATGLSVLAFDRPGFGLTSRPAHDPDAPGGNRCNPYAQRFQTRLVLRLCQRLHISSVVLVGHGDGALLALRIAASFAARTAVAGSGSADGAGATRFALDAPFGGSNGTSASPGTPGVAGAGGPAAVPTSPDWVGSAPEQQELLGRLLRGEVAPGTAWPLSLRSPAGAEGRGSGMPSPFKAPAPATQAPTTQAASREQATKEDWESMDRTSSLLPPGPPAVRGLFLTHPDISGAPAPLLGRRVLAGLLQTEVGPVANRRAWADGAGPPPEVLSMYGAARRLRAWDAALTAVARVPIDVHTVDRNRLCARLTAPVCLLTGEADAFVTPAALAALGRRFPERTPRVLLPSCGHLSHEEVPQLLVEAMTAFIRQL